MFRCPVASAFIWLVFAVSLAFYLPPGAAAQQPQPESGTGWADRTSVVAEKFMVAAAS